MRTTVEIADEHRARLVELAARGKEKGFSRIISEAIEQYFKALDRAEADRRKALKLRGSLSFFRPALSLRSLSLSIQGEGQGEGSSHI